jgi:hypothetical protein
VNRFKATHSAGESHDCCFGEVQKVVILVNIIPRGQTISSVLYIQTVKTLQKRLRRVRPHKILPSARRRKLHTLLKTQDPITEFGWTVLPPPPPTIEPRSWFLRLPPRCSRRRCHLWEEVWQWWRGYWRREEVAASTKFILVQEGDRWWCSSLAQGSRGWWTWCKKMKCVIHPSVCAMGLLKELQGKFLAIRLVL